MKAILTGMASIFALLTIAAIPTNVFAQWHKTLTYREGAELRLSCPEKFECSIALERGETIHDVYSSNLSDWQPNYTYAGHQPLLILYPTRVGLHDNFIISTSKRAYYFLINSYAGQSPSYYIVRYEESHHRAQLTAINALGPSQCIDKRYAEDRTVLPWRPENICNDGKHTFIVLPKQVETPNDIPILYVLDSMGKYTLTNYTYHAQSGWYMVDGVPDNIILMAGTPQHQITFHIQHITDRAPAAPIRRRHHHAIQ